MLTKTMRYKRDGTTYRMTVTYGFDEEFAKRANQAPYFSLTCTVWRRAKNGRWMDDGGGCMHEEIVRLFPELKPLVKRHLVACDGTPMHYLANAKYWAWGHKKWPKQAWDPDPVKAFKHTVVFGAVKGDIPLPSLEDAESVDSWLTRRLPLLRPALVKDMEALGVEVPGSAVPA
jgi:hypothetical protein